MDEKKINKNALSDEDLLKVSGGVSSNASRHEMCEIIERFYDTSAVQFLYTAGTNVKYFTLKSPTDKTTAFGPVQETRVGWYDSDCSLYLRDEYKLGGRWRPRCYLVKKEYW